MTREAVIVLWDQEKTEYHGSDWPTGAGYTSLGYGEICCPCGNRLAIDVLGSVTKCNGCV